jgi:hypothetical protein
MKFTPKQRIEIGERMRKVNTGRPWTEEHKRNFIEARRRRIKTPEERAKEIRRKISEADPNDPRYENRICVWTAQLYPSPLGICEKCHKKKATDRHHIDNNRANSSRDNI